MPLKRVDLQHHPSDILREMLCDLLLADSFDNELGWPAFAESHTNDPDNLICVYDTTGMLDEVDQYGYYAERYGIQIKVRCTDTTLGRNKAREIINTLDPLARQKVDLEGFRYLVHCCDRKGAILPLGPESQEEFRYVFTINYVVPLTLEVI